MLLFEPATLAGFTWCPAGKSRQIQRPQFQSFRCQTVAVFRVHPQTLGNCGDQTLTRATTVQVETVHAETAGTVTGLLTAAAPVTVELEGSKGWGNSTLAADVARTLGDGFMIHTVRGTVPGKTIGLFAIEHLLTHCPAVSSRPLTIFRHFPVGSLPPSCRSLEITALLVEFDRRVRPGRLAGLTAGAEDPRAILQT